VNPLTRSEFVYKYYPFVKNITNGTGIYVETLLAQAILESQGKVNGVYLVGGSLLAKNYNNLFGIKASSGWKGSAVNLKTREVFANQNVIISDSFRVYDSPEDSMKDYVNFLKVNPRYDRAGVFKAANYKDQAAALQKGGYATDPNYATLVGKLGDQVRSIINDGIKKGLISDAGTIKPNGFFFLILAAASYVLYKTLKK
jgi:flagellum-specific peptidoglycan hydrolase FlgJ